MFALLTFVLILNSYHNVAFLSSLVRLKALERFRVERVKDALNVEQLHSIQEYPLSSDVSTKSSQISSVEAGKIYECILQTWNRSGVLTKSNFEFDIFLPKLNMNSSSFKLLKTLCPNANTKMNERNVSFTQTLVNVCVTNVTLNRVDGKFHSIFENVAVSYKNLVEDDIHQNIITNVSALDVSNLVSSNDQLMTECVVENVDTSRLYTKLSNSAIPGI